MEEFFIIVVKKNKKKVCLKKKTEQNMECSSTSSFIVESLCCPSFSNNIPPSLSSSFSLQTKQEDNIIIVQNKENNIYDPIEENNEIIELKPKATKQKNVSSSNSFIKTKKNSGKKMSFSEKQKLWKIFDDENKLLKSSSVRASSCATTDSDELSSRENFCKSCSSMLILTEDGFPTCSNNKCSIINNHILDFSPEWRYYGAEDKNSSDPTRCGNPINPLLIESSLGCKILCDNKASYEMRQIRRWTEWIAMSHREKTLYDEFQFINNMAQIAGIPKIFVDHAMQIHKEISEQKMFRGMHRDSIKAASIYISCRLNNCARTPHEIADIFKIDKATATRGCSVAVNIYNNIERNVEFSQKTEFGTTTPSSFIERFCCKLNVPQELTLLAKFIALVVEKQNIICDNTPHAIASGIIFLISNFGHLEISKTDIKKICGVSEVTISKCYQKLNVIKDTIIPPSIQSKYCC